MTDEPGFRPETCETVDKLGLLRRVSTADRVPTFGDRIMVEMDRPGQWHSVVVGKYEPPKEIVEDFTSPEMLYVMRE